ncbi:MAG: hypothetical protein JNM37_08475 [Rhodocyclaceae bacterium]|nr:hypothetical protein [Rhodocyclaceae bacterium]
MIPTLMTWELPGSGAMVRAVGRSTARIIGIRRCPGYSEFVIASPRNADG